MNTMVWLSAVVCPILSLSNGNVHYNKEAPYSHSTVATHTCNEGYFLVGPAIRTCGDGSGVDGEWTPEEPVCQRMYNTSQTLCYQR